jgi:8-oxo-dGTP diphosphatase
MRQRPYVGVGILVKKDEQLLLLKRKNRHGAGSWSTPGGHLEFGESLEDCAKRETEEETGISITNVTFKAITNDLFHAEGKHYITVWMQATYLCGETGINAPYEVAEIGWFTQNALPKPLFLPLEHLLEGRCYPLA